LLTGFHHHVQHNQVEHHQLCNFMFYWYSDMSVHMKALSIFLWKYSVSCFANSVFPTRGDPKKRKTRGCCSAVQPFPFLQTANATVVIVPSYPEGCCFSLCSDENRSLSSASSLNCIFLNWWMTSLACLWLVESILQNQHEILWHIFCSNKDRGARETAVASKRLWNNIRF
jgi:hypothetical protein